jgi:ribosomal protein S18 acetylase RimI-like enzyme
VGPVLLLLQIKKSRGPMKKEMLVENSTVNDFDKIVELYDAAIAYQKTKFKRNWQRFDDDLVRKEITENRQWKIIMNGEIACIFATTLSDPHIWKEKNEDPSVYIHRIVTNPAFRGNHFMKHIIEWARDYCRANQLENIRMDTWGDNDELIHYYQQCGFELLGTVTPEQTGELPKHYSCISLALLEIKL